MKKNIDKVIRFSLICLLSTFSLFAQEAEEDLTLSSDIQSEEQEEIVEERDEGPIWVFLDTNQPEKQGDFEKTELELPGVEQEQTQKFIKQFLTESGRKVLIKSLKNSEPYRPYIIEQLKEKNMPLILQYLPIVESNYIPQAVSRSGATGIWQFMTNSMAPYLEKDSWYDDRRDPWKSTDAALSKLKYNYTFFGDWTLGIAAYNCGAGAMAAIVKKNPGKDYWTLVKENKLKKETTLYVPKLLAIADLIENADFYGCQDIKEAAEACSTSEAEEFAYIKTAGMFSFSQISKVTGIDKNKIKELNPALFRNCTPAREVYNLRLPKDAAADAEVRLREEGVATDAVMYTVKQGDSLWAISRRYNLSVADLCAVNGISEKSILSIGKKLIVPIFN